MPRVRGPEKNLDENLKKGLEKVVRNCPRTKDTGKSAPDEPWWIRGTAETCEFLQVSDETLRKWAAKGAPKVARGKWDIRELVEWKYKGSESPESRKLKAEADLKEAKASMEVIKLEAAKGNYIETALVTQDLRRLFGNIKKSLLGMGHKVATELNSFGTEEALAANKVVDEVIREALQALAEGKNYGK